MDCQQVARILKALADPTRLRIVVLLSRHRQICVCELIEIMEMPQYHLSRHLALLRNLGIVVDERVGVWVHYRLASDNELVQKLASALATTAESCERAVRDARRASKVLASRDKCFSKGRNKR